MQFAQKCMTLGSRERKKEKIEFQKKTSNSLYFFFFNYYKLLSKLSAGKSLNSRGICRLTVGTGKSLDNDSQYKLYLNFKYPSPKKDNFCCFLIF